MVLATGRDDLMKDAKAEQLQPQYKTWMAWLKEDGPYLRPSNKTFVWVVDKGEKGRQEGFLPFMERYELPVLKVRPAFPFPEWQGPPTGSPEEHYDSE